MAIAEALSLLGLFSPAQYPDSINLTAEKLEAYESWVAYPRPHRDKCRAQDMLLLPSSQGGNCEKGETKAIGCSVPEQTQIKCKIQMN